MPPLPGFAFVFVVDSRGSRPYGLHPGLPYSAPAGAPNTAGVRPQLFASKLRFIGAIADSKTYEMFPLILIFGGREAEPQLQFVALTLPFCHNITRGIILR